MNEFITLIESQLGTDFEKALFQAVLANLNDKGHPLRLNNFSYSARELIRVVLERLAPTEDVTRCPWYKDETDKENRPTRAQRIFYAIHGGLETAYVEEELGIPVLHTKRCIVQQVETLSKFTHITEDVFNVDDKEDVVALEVLSSLSNFFDMLIKSRITVTEKVSEEIVDKEVVDGVLFETDLELDALASHYHIEHVETNEVVVDHIGPDVVNIRAEGTVYVGLQWGSNSDIRKGDGATMDRSFPVVAHLTSPLQAIGEVELIHVGADTTDWWDGYYDEDL